MSYMVFDQITDLLILAYILLSKIPFYSVEITNKMQPC